MLHVDLDAFFASVEQLLDPALRGRPVIVGGTGTRGVVAAASYEARRFGVHSAMPTVRARRLCPDGAFLPPRLGVYREYSDRVFAILRSFTPLVEPISLDEAFLDVAGVVRLFGPSPEVARRIRERVRDETGLVCSVGVASTKLLAKLASDLSKPDGLLLVEPGTELEFLHPMPVGRLWGVGPATQRKLQRLGVKTIGELAAVPETTLVAGLGKKVGAHLHALAWNRDERGVTPEHETKSVSAEETFARDLVDPADLDREVRRLADRTAARLRGAGLRGRTVTLKARYGDFRTITRSTTLPEATDSSRAVVKAAAELLAAVDPADGLRLLGVGVSNIERPEHQQEALPLAGGAPEAASLDQAVDAVRARFGPDAMAPASLVDRGGLRTRRSTEHLWGPDAADPGADPAADPGEHRNG
ncbi:MAG: DNA polymerase IV [Actinobacteria bacterium]|nr:DNA polymerase IV [Actinomycetota bacterium]